MNDARRFVPGLAGETGLATRVALLVLPLAGTRVAFRAVQDGLLDAGVPRLVARHLALNGLESIALALLPALLLCWATARPQRVGWATKALVWLAAAALAFAFVTFRLPPSEVHAIQADTPRGRQALALAALVALAAAAPAVTRLRVPLARPLAGLLPLAIVVAAGVLVSWPSRGRAGRPNLVLISLDTLRRDHLGCYGYERPTSPAIDAFAARATRFENAFSVQPWTLTAHVSMLTGLYPTVHGVDLSAQLPRGVPTLADQLQSAGYVTLGVADRCPLLDPAYGFARGFGLYQQLPDRAGWKVDRILGLLDAVGQDPFFLFAHFYDAHSDWHVLPYEAAPEDRDALAPWYMGDDSSWCTPEGLCASEMLLDLFERDLQLEGERLEQLTDLYDAGIRSLDREIGRLLGGLERRGLMENTVVLLTADHGEELFDHGKPLHGRCFDECLAVPFLLYTPPGPDRGAVTSGGVSDVLASHVDILPTLLDFAGVEPLAPQQGLSLAPLIRGEALARDREAVVIETLGGLRGLRTLRWSLVPLRGERLLFDHESDPGQQRGLRAELHPDVWQQLHDRLAGEDAAAEVLRELYSEEAAEVSLSEEQQALLRNLGYAGD